VALDERSVDYADLRDGVRQLCRHFPGEYWRRLDQADEYPEELVRSLTEAGYLLR
jgi:acyl-CoA dehydrogenase